MQIPLANGCVAVVDESSFSQVHSCEFKDGYLFVGRPSEIQWRSVTHGKGANKLTYAFANMFCGGKWRAILLHRLLIDAVASEVVDHVDSNGLNNLRHNLRECSHGRNMQNRRPNSGKNVKGVSKARYSWRAEIKVGGKRIGLGSHSTEEAAARAYDEAAKKYHGEFALLNFA